MEVKSPKSSRIRIIRNVFACFFSLVIGSAEAHAEFATITPQKDGTLIEDIAGYFANGSGPAIFAGRISSLADPRRRALLAFDIGGSVPAGSTITSATLVLQLSGTNAGPVEVTLHRVDAEWGEGAASSSGGGGAASQMGDATWVHRFYDSEFWASPGGDFDSTPHGVSRVDQIGPYLWNSTPEMVADVQSWLDDPAGNHGWILLGDETRPTTVKRFDSRESPDESTRPLLAVDYIPPCSPDPRGLGYWQRQCPDEEAVTTGPPKEPRFSEWVLPCAERVLGDLGLEGIHPCEAILANPPLACEHLALRKLSVLILNVCSGRYQTSCPIDAIGNECVSPNVGELLHELSFLVLSGSCRRASDCASLPEQGETRSPGP